MPLSNHEYQEITASYENQRKQNEDEKEKRIREVYDKIPRIRQIDECIERFSLEMMQEFLRTRGSMEEIAGDARARVEGLLEEKTGLLKEAGYPEDYLELHYSCPDCQDTGYVGRKMCRCMKQKIAALNQKHANLGALASKQNFDHFDLEKFSDELNSQRNISPRENMQRILCHIRQDLDASHESLNLNYYLTGAAGTGKTFMCSCIADEVLKMGYTVYYVSAYDFIRIMGDHRFHRESEKDARACEMFFDVDLLVIDDLGTEAPNAISTADLFYCVNQRINTEKSTIISTNLSLSQLTKSYSDRLTSRILGCYQVMTFIGEDLRWAHLKK